MGAQNFNLAPKFIQNGGFSAQNFAFLDENFPMIRKFSDSPKFTGGDCPLPCHDATDFSFVLVHTIAKFM